MHTEFLKHGRSVDIKVSLKINYTQFNEALKPLDNHPTVLLEYIGGSNGVLKILLAV